MRSPISFYHPRVYAPLVFLLVLLFAFSAHAGDGKLLLKVVDAKTGKPIACRIHLRNSRGRPVKVSKAPFWKDHFVFDGEILLDLRKGSYAFELERGPEYKVWVGRFEIDNFAKDEKTIKMTRFVDMAKHGWWSGELHIHRPIRDMKLIMRAEDLHVGPVITWWNKKSFWKKHAPPKDLLVQFDGNRFYHVMAGEDERGGGALMFFNLQEPLKIDDAQREFPSSMKYLLEARRSPGVHIDIEKPFWWDVPIWLASGKIDSIGLANNHMWRDGVLANEAWGKPRDKKLLPGLHGNGRWSQQIYYDILNAGLKIPPSAGSASGVLPNPVGYNRVYVKVEGEFTYEKWWEALRAGKVVVTNGPLLRPNFNGQPPGHTFNADKGEKVTLKIGMTLSTRDKIEYLEIIKNGRVIDAIRLDAWAKAGGKLPPVTFEKSGWLLVRAVTENKKSYRFASTGPVYVEIDGQQRISKRAAQFFLDWVRQRSKRIDIDDPKEREEVLRYHRQAESFWKQRVENANAE